MMKGLWILGKLLCTAYVMMLCVVMSSCWKNENEWMKSEAVEFDVEGISVINSEREFQHFHGTIPSEGCNFRIYGKGKYAKETYVTTVIIYNNPLIENNTFGDNYESPTADSIPDISGVWGRIDYLSVEPPYAMDVQIEANTDGVERIFIIQLGCCYTYSRIRLIQPAE